MAIDTEDKRRSAQSFPWGLSIRPVADGTVGTTDRAHETGFYSGIAYAAAPILVAPDIVNAATMRLLVVHERSIALAVANERDMILQTVHDRRI